MSRASEKLKDGTEGKAESTGSMSEEEEEEEDIDVDDAGREETPDLYRHSALGMYVFHIVFHIVLLSQRISWFRFGGVSMVTRYSIKTHVFFFQEMEDVHYSQDDEMDEGDEDEEEDVDMEYGDETDSEATSNSDEEIDAEEEDAEDEDGSRGDGWRDADEEYEEEDLIENDEDGDGGVGAVTGADQDIDEDMMWQVCPISSFHCSLSLA
jgi:E3 ubiquitin-protein ligase HUWE1